MIPSAPKPLRQILLTRFAGLVTATTLMVATGLVVLGLQPVAERIAESQFRAATARVETSLYTLFSQADKVLAMAIGWLDGRAPSLEYPDTFNQYFKPVLAALPQATSVVAGTPEGQGWLLLQQENGTWRNRMTDRATWGDRHLLIDHGPQGAMRTWAQLDYDARTRPWFKVAAATAMGKVAWTEPYRFFTTGDPGITATTRTQLRDGQDLLLGIDLKLRDLSHATMKIRVGERGMALVLTDDLRLFALPAMPPGMAQTEWMQQILRPARELGIPPLAAGLARWRQGGQPIDTVLSYRSGGEAWLLRLRPYPLGGQRLWMATLAPESEFAPAWLALLAALFAALLLLLGVAILIARGQALRIARPLEALAAASERIGQLDFTQGPLQASRIAEIDRLATAQEAMRALLERNQGTLSAQADDLRGQIAALREAKANLRESDDYNKVLFADSGIPLVVLDPETGRFVDCNAAAARIYHLPNREAVLGLSVADVSAPFQYDGRLTGVITAEFVNLALERGSHVFEWRHRRPDGQAWDAEVRLMAFRHRGRPLLQFSLQDITERKQAEQQLEYLAFNDVLTGLPNRVLLLDRLHQALAAAERSLNPVSLLLLDLDRFKEINDTQGHSVGDKALVEVARRFQSVLRQGESIARVGGDEFVVLAPGADQSTARLIAERLLASLATPVEVRGQLFSLGVSIGIALSPEDGASAEILLRHADVAMYRAKTAGGGYRYYSPDMSVGLAEDMVLARDLKAALRGGSEDELLLYYQPQVSLHDNRLVGAEVLLRWHRGGCSVNTQTFIAIAEERGMMRELGAWVLARACRQIQLWEEAGTPLHGRLAINISAQEIEDVRFPEQAAALVRKAGLDPSRFELELTESGVMRNVDVAHDNIDRLQQAGFALAIDDFGTGYSSLAYLKRLPVDKIKIDISFVRDMLEDRNDYTIVKTIIGMGRTLDLTIIAEGVEQLAQAGALLDLGCGEAQGNYFGPPQDAADFARAWLEDSKNPANCDNCPAD